MRRLIAALIAAPMFLGAAAYAQPTQQPSQLSDAQMDAVSAGFHEEDVSNTSFTVIEIFQRPYLLDPTPNTISCPGCFLEIITPTFSVGSRFGP